MSRAARRLNVSPSSLSVQLKALEEQLEQQLFDRRGKTLQLTEAGRIALDYANTVFKSGHELIDALTGLAPGRQVLRIGTVATLSRNFQMGILKSLMGREGVELVINSGGFSELLAQLEAHKLDLVLANQPAVVDADSEFQNTLLAEQPVSLVGHPSKRKMKFKFPDDLNGIPIVLPARGSAVRSAFDTLVGSVRIKLNIVAEVDDMAMLRLMARENTGLTLVPPVVVIDELRSGFLVERYQVPKLREQFYAIARRRRFPNALVAELIHKQAAKRRHS